MAPSRRTGGHLPAAVGWLLLLFGSYTSAISTPDTLGTEFVLAFGPMHPTVAAQAQLSVYLACSENAQVDISYYNAATPTTTSVSVVANQALLVPLPRSLMQVTRGVAENLGVKITSDKEIAVSALQYTTQSSDGFLVYPVDILSKDYFAATFVSNLAETSGAYLQIIATDATATTDFTVKTTMATNLGGPGEYTFTLSALQSFLIGTAMLDATLSGTTLAASSPFALLIGSRCNVIPKNTKACDNLIEQMPPPGTLGRRFMLGTFLHPAVSAGDGSTSQADVVQVMATSDATTLQVGGSLVATLNKGETHIFDVPIGTAIYLEASDPAYVLHLSKGQASGLTGDPMMIGVPPIYQFMNSYIIGVPMLTSTATHYLNIMYEGDNRDGVLLDGAGIDNSKWLTVPGNEKAFVARVIVTHSATHVLTHQDPKETVGVEVYAFTDWTSYGWTGGQAIDTSRVEPVSACSKDIIAPSITCPTSPAPVSSAAASCDATVAYGSIAATDDCGTPVVECDHASGSKFPVGSTLVTCTAKDAAGNSATCSFNVIVKDMTPPVINCPSNPAPVNNVAGTCAAPVTFSKPVATDNCPGSVDMQCSRTSGSSFKAGSTTVTCTAKDSTGNKATCAFKVTVKAKYQCNDGNACTKTDTCKEDGKGTCVGGDNICCGPGKSSKYCGVCVKVCRESKTLSSDACNVLKFFGQDPRSVKDCDVKSIQEKCDRVCPQGTTCCMPQSKAVKSSSKNGYCGKF